MRGLQGGISVSELTEELEHVAERMAPLFARSEARMRAGEYLQGLLASIPRKNAWQLSEAIGQPSPYAIQNLLGRSVWSAEELQNQVRDYVLEHLGDEQGILVLDETGFLKKGTNSAGVKRQYSGTAGRIENCQIGVFLAYVSGSSCAFLDRELYVPKEWIEDENRSEAAGIPADREFATKVELAEQMLIRAIDHNVPFAWVVANELYSPWSLRRKLEQQSKNSVLAVNRTQEVFCGRSQRTVETMVNNLPKSKWRTITIGEGSKGLRKDRYARVEINHDLGPSRCRWLLVRESLSDASDRAYYLACAPTRTTLTQLATIAGHRWWIEMGFELSKQETGLDEYEVRSYEGWHRHITLSLLAHAMLVVLRHKTNEVCSKKVRSRSSR